MGTNSCQLISIDHLQQTALKGNVPDHVLIGYSNCCNCKYFSAYNPKLADEKNAETVQKMRVGLQQYTDSGYRFISAPRHEGRFFVLDITFDIRQPDVFQTVIVYDSLSITSSSRATAVLLMLQNFVSGFCFHGLDHNLLPLHKPDYIV
ncbi:hypothetical protein IV203_029343 [Nitzschia inconspicua]|uniref:Uncharacterized protein n=1 Tax=Nitzschia inconspicua TaxID=303405 RepID=A0A9K3Q0P1_9STRA|nr:hypothetical protein IV203_029343 [Nitzschia inconspicua]